MDHTFIVDGLINGGVGWGLYPGGLISRIIYSSENELAYIRRGLKPGGGLKVGFHGSCSDFASLSLYHFSMILFLS